MCVNVNCTANTCYLQKKKILLKVWITFHQTNGKIISWKTALISTVNLPGKRVRNNWQIFFFPLQVLKQISSLLMWLGCITEPQLKNIAQGVCKYSASMGRSSGIPKEFLTSFMQLRMLGECWFGCEAPSIKHWALNARAFLQSSLAEVYHDHSAIA